MGSLFKIAWRNLGRNPRRTVVTGLALVVGTTLSIAVLALLDGFDQQMLHALTKLDVGHLQVHENDYLRKRSLKLTLPKVKQIEAALAANPEVVASSPRVYGFGLLSHKRQSQGVQLLGLDPTREASVTELHKNLKHGQYVANQPTPWPKGRDLTQEEQRRDDKLTQSAVSAAEAELEGLDSLDETDDGKDQTAETKGASQPNDPSSKALTRELARTQAPPPDKPLPVVIGKTLAKRMDIKVGTEMFITVQSIDGISVEVKARVSGIFATGTPAYDRGRILLHIVDAQRLLRIGSRIHELAAITRNGETADQTAQALQQQMPEGTTAASWGMLSPTLKTMLQQNEAGSVIIVLIIFLVATLGIVNTMLMAIFERTRELGVLKAIGLSGLGILRLVVAETTLLALISGLVGALFGILLSWYLSIHGINLSASNEATSLGGIGIDPVMRAILSVRAVVLPVVVLCSCAFIASFYPAIRAARMRPAQGMRDL